MERPGPGGSPRIVIVYCARLPVPFQALTVKLGESTLLLLLPGDGAAQEPKP